MKQILSLFFIGSIPICLFGIKQVIDIRRSLFTETIFFVCAVACQMDVVVLVHMAGYINNLFNLMTVKYNFM